MNKARLTILMIFALCFKALPQSFPVQAGIQIVPPYSTRLSDYVAPGSQRMFLNAFLTDINRPSLDVRLRITIEGQGIRLQTRQDYFPSPITLNGGMASQLTAFDLEPYFRAENLIIEGLSRQQFINSGGSLPEGVYRFCVEVLEFNRGVKISNQTCATAWLILNDPPFINVPAQGDKLRITDPQYITFQWTPRHTGSPNSAFSTVYEFSLVEIWPSGRNPNDAILTSPPIFETTTPSTTVIYGPSDPALVPGREYAFRVRAISEVGIEQVDLFRNDGFTQTQMFKYGDECLAPQDFEVVSSSSRKIEIQWQTLPNHTQFSVRYREKGKTGWTTEEIFFNDYTVSGLTPDTEYEIQVGGMCGFLNSNLTAITKVSTDAIPVSEFSCGTSMDEINLENVQPIESLQEGDIIYAGDFDVSLTKISGSNGTFSGEGIVVVPFMNHVKVGVAFTNVKVNDESRMYEGNMHFTALTGQVLTDDQLASIDDLLADLEDFEEKLDEVLETTEEVVEEINEIIETIQETEVFEEEEYEELLASSEEELVAKANEEIEEAVAATASGNVVEAAKKVARAKTIKKIAESKQQQRLGTDTATVVAVEFTGAEDFGFDPRPEHGGFDLNYQKLVSAGNDVFVPWASVAVGQSNEITAKWISNSGVNKEEITFTLDNQSISGTSTNDGWTFDIPSGEKEKFQELKARAKGSVVGKIPIMTYEQIERTVVLVSVNNAGNDINTSTVEEELNEIYGEAAVRWKVESTTVNIDQAEWDLNSNGSMFVDQNNDLSAYPDELKAFIRAFKDKTSNVSNDKYYLFLTDATNSASVAGFMPRKKQFGFIFTQSGGDNLTIAHELGHGAFRLQHVWEEAPNISQSNTVNLMDYGGGNSLNKHQWDQIHDPKWVVTLFDAEDEGTYSLKDLLALNVSESVNNPSAFFSQYGFMLPTGVPISLPENVTKLRFHRDSGVLFEFELQDTRYVLVITTDGFEGYIPYEDRIALGISKGIYTQQQKEAVESKRYDLKLAGSGKTFALIQERHNGQVYANCYCRYEWDNEVSYDPFYGAESFKEIPSTATKQGCSGSDCGEIPVKPGLGTEIYLHITRKAAENGRKLTDNEETDLITLSDWLTDSVSNKTFSFYYDDLQPVTQDGKSIHTSIRDFIYDERLWTKSGFTSFFGFGSYSQDYGIIFSTKDLRKDIPDGYNIASYNFITKGDYHYTFRDLVARQKILFEAEAGDVFKTLITEAEDEGRAEAISIVDGAAQYTAQYGTNSAFPYIAKASAEWAQQLLGAYFLRRLVAEYGLFVVNELLKRLQKDALMQLVREKGKDFIQGAVIDYGIQATFNYYFDEKITTFSEAASPGNINWISVVVSGVESTVSYKNKFAALGVPALYGCFVNGLTTEDGFNDDFDVVGCGAGVAGAILGKFVGGSISYVRKIVLPLAKYSNGQLRKGLTRLGITGQKADDIIDKIRNSADDVGSAVTGTKVNQSGSISNQLDNISVAASDYAENSAEIVATNNGVSDAAKVFWSNHEMNVTRYLRGTFGNSKVGRQISVDIFIDGMDSPVRCRLDNIIDLGNGKFRIIDAKSSTKINLSKIEASKLATQRSTPNQQTFYSALQSGKVKQIKPVGQNAVDFFENNIPDNLNIENNIEFFVNNHSDDGYDIFKIVY